MKPRTLLTAPQVARLCGADLKTIHNWVNAGRMRHFRTPGRHLRFREEDVVEFMVEFGYPVPQELEGRGRMSVVVLDPDRESRAKVRRSLARSFDVAAFGCPVEALLAIGREQPAAVAVDSQLPGIDGYHLIARLSAMELTKASPVVVYAEATDDGRWREAGAAAFVRKPSVARLREQIGELVGRA
jgi:excisionase family DNA binding protein